MESFKANLFHLQQITVVVRLRITPLIALVTITVLRLGMILRRLMLMVSIRLDWFWF